MDVRCEKCQTEYELDESRLKPGGVTVKCTNCGHMFKIRKRSSTNVGLPATAAASSEPPRIHPPSRQTGPAAQVRAQSPAADAPVGITDAPSGPHSERQWLVRLDNGETKTCKELAVLQQWIVAGVVTRESLISRSGKTWKRLGDIPELSQYFVIADEARAARSVKPTSRAGGAGAVAATMMGVGATRPPSADDDLEARATGNFRAREPTPPPPPAASAPRTTQPKVSATAPTEIATGSSVPGRRPPTEPPPPPPGKGLSVPPGRATAAWANNEIKASESMAAMPQGPRGGKLSAGPDEPAFAGRVRIEPSDDAAFRSGRVRAATDDEDLYRSRRGSRAGMWIALFSLLLIGAAVGVVYMLVFKADQGTLAQPAVLDAAAEQDTTGIAVTPIDSQAEAADPLAGARAELRAGVNARIKNTLDSLTGQDDPETLAMRARLSLALAQSLLDRAALVDKAEADKLRKESKQLVIDTAPLAQRAHKGQQDSASANLAMADVLRLQGKPAPSVKRYIDGARSHAGGDPELTAAIALAEARLALRDGNLAAAQQALAAAGVAPDDMQIKLAQAQLAYAQNKPTDAKAIVDQIVATQPDHEVGLAFYKRLETTVAKTDPLPPEESTGGDKSTGSDKPTGADKRAGGDKPPGGGGGGGGGGDYDSLLARANKLAETSCAKAMDFYMKALELKPNGVEALTGMGYCHLDAKQFSSAFSKFRAALAVSARFEPALGGIAETYQRQGNKEAAIEAWRRYMEVYPSSPKARKQLELLGASPDGDKKPEAKRDPKPEGEAKPASDPPAAPPTPDPGEGSAASG